MFLTNKTLRGVFVVKYATHGKNQGLIYIFTTEFSANGIIYKNMV